VTGPGRAVIVAGDGNDVATAVAGALAASGARVGRAAAEGQRLLIKSAARQWGPHPGPDRPGDRGACE
jgi:hypothetical protein